MGAIIPVACIIIFLIVAGSVLYPVIKRINEQKQNSQRLEQEGILDLAKVVNVAQTGVMVNRKPEIRLSLEFNDVNGKARQIEVAQLMEIGTIPRINEQVYILIDPKDAGKIVLAKMPLNEKLFAQSISSVQTTTNIELRDSTDSHTTI